jgi:hypothetical protein
MPRTFVNPLARRRKAGYPEATERLEANTRELLQLSDDVVVSIYEFACCGPGCPDVETIVAVRSAKRKPQVARVQKRIPEITMADLATAFGLRKDRRNGTR